LDWRETVVAIRKARIGGKVVEIDTLAFRGRTKDGMFIDRICFVFDFAVCCPGYMKICQGCPIYRDQREASESKEVTAGA
jgi:hypothetical protein